ncbi:GPI transamidase component PIG-T-like [Schistocerca gregaria]|uniref:GPI transamidase component PIG-T-like n=1 Tax=Schistocerca gregaria TaxID=7010 RepID=UPI00211DECF8|nr:GPI transamidase component PIG-T-like [Schistocerca gregaria]
MGPFPQALLLLLGVCLFTQHASSEFSEELHIYPLPVDGYFILDLRFGFDYDGDHSARHFKLFPREIGQLVHRLSIEEFQLRITKGAWPWDEWYAPSIAAPEGVELWAYYQPESSTNTDQLWKSTAEILSEYICGSIEPFYNNVPSRTSNKWLDQNTYYQTYPRYNMFHLQPSSSTMSKNFRRGFLSPEVLCTENFDSLSKWLPCHFKSGIASILSPPTSLRSTYSSLSLHYFPTPSSKKFLLSFSFLVRKNTRVPSSIPWDITTLSSISPPDVCSLSSHSTLHIHPTLTSTSVPVDLYSTLSNHLTLVSLPLPPPSPSPPPVIVTRWVSSPTLRHGRQFIVSIQNHSNHTYHILYHQPTPPYLPLYIHTLQPYINSSNSSHPTHVQYSPTSHHNSTLTLSLSVPPFTHLLYSMDCELAFPDRLRVSILPTSYYYLPPALVHVTPPNTTHTHTLYTDTWVLYFHDFDFSMGFNTVACMQMSIILLYGFVLNIVFKDYRESFHEGKFITKKGPFLSLTLKLLSNLKKRRLFTPRTGSSESKPRLAVDPQTR